MDDNISIEDLKFEVKRLRQKCEILERNSLLFDEEQKLSSNAVNSCGQINMMTEECKKKNVKIHKLQSIITSLYSKYAVVLRNLQLEKLAMQEIRTDCLRFGSAINDRSCAAIISSFNDLYIKARTSIGCDISQEYVRNMAILNEEITNLRSENNRNRQLLETKECENSLLKDKLSENKSYLEHENSIITENNMKLTDKLQQLSEKMSFLQQTYKDDLASIVETKDMNMMLKENENKMLNDQVLLLNNTIQRLHNEYKSLQSSHQNEVNNALHDVNQRYGSELAELKSQFKCQTEEMSKLQDIHNKLQSDYHVLIRKEEILKKESLSKHDDITDLRMKLHSISTKIAIMEGEHTEEMKRLLNKNDMISNDYQILQNQLKSIEKHNIQLEAINKQLEKRCKDLEEQLILDKKAIEQKYNELIIEKDRLLNKTNESDKHILYAETQYKQIDEERNRMKEKHHAALSTIELLQKSIQNHEMNYSSLSREKEVLTASLQDMNKVILELKSTMNKDDKTEQIAGMEKTIQDLKLTIHKECTERTEMMIEISELKDYINKLNMERNSIGCGSSDSRSASMILNQLHNSGIGLDTDIQAGVYNNHIQPEDEEGDLGSGDENNKLWLQKFRKGKASNNSNKANMHRTRSGK